MKLRTNKIKYCLLCKNKKMKELFSLGSLFVSNFVNRKNINKGIKAPLNLLYCTKCSLLQFIPMIAFPLNYSKFLIKIT